MAREAEDDPFVGRLLDGRYRVEEVLGRGGMGSVYLALDERMGRPVVVKVPHSRFLAEPGFRERFAREVRAQTELEHPHVARALDAGSVDGVPYAVLQHLGGGSLRDRISERGGRLSSAEVGEWLPAVASALDFIHRQGMVHRDVKPGNVLFDDVGNVFLADFGIAKALGTLDTSLTQTGATPGSPDYMGPEVSTGAELGPAYDQYALAAVVYQALSGRLPHEADTPLRLLYLKASEPPTPLRAVAGALSLAASGAVMRALSRDPADRFPSCSAFAAQFARPSAGAVESSTASATPFPSDRGTLKRGPRFYGALALALLVLAVGAVVAARVFRADSPARPVTSGPPALAVAILSPVEGALLPSRLVTVVLRLFGTVPAEPVPVWVNGAEVAGTEKPFTVTARAAQDGPFTIEAHAGSTSMSRNVFIDATAPVVEITSVGQATDPGGIVTVSGKALDVNLLEVRIEDRGEEGAIPYLMPDGSFTWQFRVSAEEAERTVTFVAVDRAGNRSAPASRRVGRRKR